jgi:hypothetical protein
VCLKIVNLRDFAYRVSSVGAPHSFTECLTFSPVPRTHKVSEKSELLCEITLIQNKGQTNYLTSF